eukprot:11831572-Heterocapsa_arctica.AAC.1
MQAQPTPNFRQNNCSRTGQPIALAKCPTERQMEDQMEDRLLCNMQMDNQMDDQLFVGLAK